MSLGVIIAWLGPESANQRYQEHTLEPSSHAKVWVDTETETGALRLGQGQGMWQAGARAQSEGIVRSEGCQN